MIKAEHDDQCSIGWGAGGKTWPPLDQIWSVMYCHEIDTSDYEFRPVFKNGKGKQISIAILWK